MSLTHTTGANQLGINGSCLRCDTTSWMEWICPRSLTLGANQCTSYDLILQQVVPLPWRGMVMLPPPAAYHGKVMKITDTYDMIGFFFNIVYDQISGILLIHQRDFTDRILV